MAYFLLMSAQNGFLILEVKMVPFLIFMSFFFSLIGVIMFFDQDIDDDTYKASKIQKAIGSVLLFYAVVMLVIAFDISR